MSDAYLLNNNTRAAREKRRSEETLLQKEMAADPQNKDLDDAWIVLQRALAAIDEREGDSKSARMRLESALNLATQMMKYDPGNEVWAQSRRRVVGDLLRVQHK